MNPIFYILVTLFFTSIIWSVIFLMSWYTLGKKQYAMLWTIAFAFSACQWATMLAEPLFNSHTLYWMLGSSFSVGSVLLGTWGHCIRVNSGIKIRYLIISAIVTLAAVYYFTAIYVHVGLFMSLYVYYDVILLVLNAVIIFRHKQKSLPAEIGASITYTLCGLLLFVAASIALLQGSQVNEEYIALYTLINFITVPTAHVGMAVFIIFMMASDLAEKMNHLAMSDELTGCLNRRGFYNKSQEQLKDKLNNYNYVSLIYWDIDKFKKINDEFGHAGGDLVLVEAAKIMQNCINPCDLFGRIGGEEFALLIARNDESTAKDLPEKLRSALASYPIHFNDKVINVTASFGVINIKCNKTTIESAINEADKALYHAKNEGRNQVAHVNTLS
ncbi:GGDEF domain-containing protein [Pseudoalteromonas sp. AS84]|jgi:diguanylate cyclase (GGDEF)-like protein|uniref:diguanylate cyclase n=2 Tax=Pseudoalteromonas TaxID=53246 RepID=A0A7X9U5F2_9GAMM|nr:MULTISPECIES: GGDEF domain-containing protein [Pseudoalteromonas]NMF47930.1 GGDEF domain-containing protein [Pseudoalteromonas arctica]|tara:strand:- start:286 stop:1446 length:1161 start_codon:yes stop_codon:yes gene_type:complete